MSQEESKIGLPVTPPPSLEVHELSTEENLCGVCHKPAVALFALPDGVAACGICEALARQRREAYAADNARRRGELVETIGRQAAAAWTLDKFEAYDDLTAKSLTVAREFHPSTSNLYLFGTPGCGKSHLAVALAMRGFAEGRTVHFFASGPALSRRFRGKIDPDEYERRLKELAKAEILVINELGIGADSEHSIQVAVEVIDARIMRGRNGLIVTSNLHPAELAAKMADTRLESRFSGLCRIIEVGRQDFRKLHRVA